jgi:hypothetical protein
LHAGLPIAAEDRDALERLVRYIGRPPLSSKRLSELEDGRLCLRLKRAWDDGTSFFLFRPEQLLGRLAAIVPHPSSHLVHYFGVLAPHAKWRPWVVPEGEPELAGVDLGLVRPARRSSWIPWSVLLARVFGVDILRCPRCGGTMQVRAVVETMETAQKLLEEVLEQPYQLHLLQPSRSARAGPAFWS